MKEEQLPEHILLVIFSHLSLQELILISRVCKRWQRVSRDSSLWQSVQFCREDWNQELFQRLIVTHLSPGLKHMSLRGCDVPVASLTALSLHCPKLTTLVLRGSRVTLGKAVSWEDTTGFLQTVENLDLRFLRGQGVQVF